jgi:ATP-dependent Clp protease ATP-binding subunit ClpC
VGAGAAEGAIDAANILKPALGRGEIQMLGATTLEEYRKCVEKDPKNRYRSVDKLKKDLKKIAVKNARRKKSAKEVPQEEESN